MRNEILHGTEALNTLPFAEVAVGKEKAIAHLVARTQSVVKQNFDLIHSMRISSPGAFPQTPALHDQEYRILSDPELCGVSLSRLKVEEAYDVGKLQTFAGHISDVVTLLQIKRENPNPLMSRKSTTVCLGAMSDLAALLDGGGYSSYKDGLQVIRSELILQNISPYEVGVMIDDAAHLRGAEEGKLDPMSDRDAAQGLQLLYESSGSEEDKLRFALGMRQYANTQPLSENRALISLGQSEN